MRKNIGIISWNEKDFPMAGWKWSLPGLPLPINVLAAGNVRASAPLTPSYQEALIVLWGTAAMNVETAM